MSKRKFRGYREDSKYPDKHFGQHFHFPNINYKLCIINNAKKEMHLSLDEI